MSKHCINNSNIDSSYKLDDNITYLIIKNSKISNESFIQSNNLIYLYIDKCELGDTIFNGCKSLKYLYIKNCNISKASFMVNDSLEFVKLVNVDSIGKYSFGGCNPNALFEYVDIEENTDRSELFKRLDYINNDYEKPYKVSTDATDFDHLYYAQNHNHESKPIFKIPTFDMTKSSKSKRHSLTNKLNKAKDSSSNSPKHETQTRKGCKTPKTPKSPKERALSKKSKHESIAYYDISPDEENLNDDSMDIISFLISSSSSVSRSTSTSNLATPRKPKQINETNDIDKIQSSVFK